MKPKFSLKVKKKLIFLNYNGIYSDSIKMEMTANMKKVSSLQSTLESNYQYSPLNKNKKPELGYTRFTRK